MKAKLQLALIALLCLGITNGTFAQGDYDRTSMRNSNEQQSDSIKGLYVGLNVGAYFANKYDAALYNGYGFDRNGDKLEFAESWLNQQFTREISRDQIEEAVQYNNIAFGEADIPYEMVYDPGIMVGLHLRYNMDKQNSFILDFNFTQLRSSGQFTIERVGYTDPDPAKGSLLYFPIIGQEQRFYLNPGYHRVFGHNPTLNFYGEIGANLTYAQFQENRIEINGYSSDITIDRNRIGQRQQKAIEISSFGLGGFVGAGAQLTLGEKFTVDLGYDLMNTRIKLLENSTRTFQHAVILRAIYM